MKSLVSFFCCIGLLQAAAQHYTTANVHSHNDYEQSMPFTAAWKAGFGSVEADIFLDGGELIVAHDTVQVKKRRTLQQLYLQPLYDCMVRNGGTVYADGKQQLLLLVDIKTETDATLKKLVEVLQQYPALTAAASLKIVVSGNRPQPGQYHNWPEWLLFDGDPGRSYSDAEWKRVGLLSANFARYTKWNGKGRIPEQERKTILALVNDAHTHNRKIRFWNSPDMLNSWYGLMDMGVDYLNTDHIDAISQFLRQLPDRSFTNTTPHELYKPEWRNDGTEKKVKNIILIVGDGTGLAQWYAGYTANRAALNVFNMRHSGLSKTSSYDNYITDSAPGATAFSAGIKTNNRAVGVDHTGQKLLLLPSILKKQRKKTGLITSGDLRDATPAAFYAHQSERSSYAAILNDLYAAPVDIIMGACQGMPDSLHDRLLTKMKIYSSLSMLPATSPTPVMVADSIAAKPAAAGRGAWLQEAFTRSVQLLSANRDGFFLMIEGAQVDHGGHANRLPWLVTELLDLDKLIGRAMAFADQNGETLVVVTGDHETGGLTLTGGDYTRGFISGQFSTEDHTAVPVPVYAYGPGSQKFDGVYENTEIFRKLLQVLGSK
ncbi:alkaline phosphatase [Sediminibacterium soli]|uniref:alkaline phosphatase n=1 Tax=Sediminibacterium soli TaxID=2698829 RepID=UPI00137AEA47|nr:alkaline phosphatase [Sediminibacterium soli]NCI48161.1 alkaline phosphatase [Sediminibacterium soli]